MKDSSITLIITGVVLPIVLLSVGCGFKRYQPPPKPALHPIKIITSDEGFLVTESDKRILFYQRLPKSQDAKYTRANYVHPLYNLDGDILTEDFPADHRHHRGIFWAWHQVYVGQTNVGDGWSIRNISWDVYDAKIQDVSADCRAIVFDVNWLSLLWTDAQGNAKPFIKETTKISVHSNERHFRKIDFEIKLLALEDGVRIGGAENAKEYGGFSTRIRLPEGVVFTDPKGVVEPKGTPVEASPWMDFSGRFGRDDSVSGLAVLCHKSNPLYEHGWILRRKGSMQNHVYPGRHPVLLSREAPLILRYRLIIHCGNANHVDLNKLHVRYNAEPPL
ncbi:MAG: DUF6807 family protein [Planctomycetota bacterium]|jgi:hypothetical protein